MNDEKQNEIDIEEIDEESNLERNRELQREKFKLEVANYHTVDEILQELPDGFKVAVHRISPRWCEGHIETVLVHRDEETGLSNIDADELRRCYGGHTLTLRFLDERGRFIRQKTMTFADEPPKRGGKPLVSPEEKEAQLREDELRRKLDNESKQSDMKMIDLITKLIPDKSSNDNGSAMMTLLLTQMQESNKQMAMQQQYAQKMAQDNLALQIQMMEKMMNKSAPDPMEQFSQTMQIMTMSKELLGSGSDDKSSDEIQSMISGILGMVGGKNKIPNSSITAAPKPLSRPSVQSKIPPMDIGNKINLSENEKKVDNNTVLDDNDDISSLSEKLIEMDESKLATLISDTLANMPKSKQEKIFGAFESLGDDDDGEDD